MANVFISHRSGDDIEAERLAQEVKNNGHKVWLDLWNIKLGDSIVARINEGLEGANYVVICYSSFGIDSSWMGQEWRSSLAQQLNGYNVTVLPVKLTEGNPPAILADIKYADLTKDWTSGVSELLRAIH